MAICGRRYSKPLEEARAMKLHVVFNNEGEILGAAEVKSGARIRARPMPDKHAGHRATDVYVPAEYHHYDLAAVCQRLRVDVGGAFPNLKAKD
jgi:hypothetical protein